MRSLGTRAFEPSGPWIALLLTALPVAVGTALAWSATTPLIAAALAGGALAVVVAGRFARRWGVGAVWLTAITFSLLGGGVSAISMGGQNGRMLWVDAVVALGVACALLRDRFALSIPRAPLLVALIPVVVWSTASLLVAEDVLTGIAELKEWYVATVVATIAVTFARDARRARLLIALVAVTGAMIAGHMAITAFRSPLGPVFAVLLKKVDLPYGRTNYLAGLQLLGLTAALGLMGHALSWRGRISWLMVLAMNAGGIVLSASKGAIVALGVSLIVTFAGGGRAARIGGLVMAAIIALAVAVFSIGPLQRVMRYRLQASALDYSVSERMDLYRLAWHEFGRHPITGLGLNNFSVTANRLRGVDTVPHNLELGFLAELGIPGLVLVLAWLGTLAATAWRARARAPTSRDRALALALWCSFLAFVVHNQFESTIYGEQFKILLMLMAAATWRLGEEWSVASERTEPMASVRDVA